MRRLVRAARQGRGSGCSKAPLCAALVSLALLSGCGKADIAEVPVQQAGADYRAPLVAQLAGTYAGVCDDGNGAASAGEITVSPAGLIHAKGFEHDLNGDDVSILLSRTLAQGQPSGLEFRTGGAAQQWTFALVSGSGEWASTSAAGTTRKCEQVAQVSDLRARPLYPQVASFFTEAPASLDCAGAPSAPLETGVQQVVPLASGISIGPAKFAFDSSIRSETVVFEPQPRKLIYRVAFDDQATLTMQLDAAGKLSEVMWTDTAGGSLMCSAPRA